VTLSYRLDRAVDSLRPALERGRPLNVGRYWLLIQHAATRLGRDSRSVAPSLFLEYPDLVWGGSQPVSSEPSRKRSCTRKSARARSKSDPRHNSAPWTCSCLTKSSKRFAASAARNVRYRSAILMAFHSNWVAVFGDSLTIRRFVHGRPLGAIVGSLEPRGRKRFGREKTFGVISAGGSQGPTLEARWDRSRHPWRVQRASD